MIFILRFRAVGVISVNQLLQQRIRFCFPSSEQMNVIFADVLVLAFVNHLLTQLNNTLVWLPAEMNADPFQPRIVQHRRDRFGRYQYLHILSRGGKRRPDHFPTVKLNHRHCVDKGKAVIERELRVGNNRHNNVPQAFVIVGKR